LLPATLRLALTLTLFASTSGAVVSKVDAPATVTAPEPRPAEVPRVTVPAFSVVPPL